MTLSSAARLTFALLTGALLLVAGPAFAHVTANPAEAPAGEHARIDLRVSHGCDGSPTTAVSVQIPDTVASVTPEFIPGWTVETKTGPLAEPVEVHGETVDEGIREVTWSGGEPIPDHHFFEFGLSVRLPDAAGETLYFPVIQTCESGETAWIEVPEDGQSADELESPAPAVTLVDGGPADTVAASEPAASEAAADTDAAPAPVASEPVAAALTSAQENATGDGVVLAALALGVVALVVAVAALVVARRTRT